MPKRTSDRGLANAAASGDIDAFRALYRAYVKPVYWIAHGILSAPQDAEDVVQETFVVAWRKLPELELVGESLLPWLATICRFQAANKRRQLFRERQHTTEVIDETLAGAANIEQDVITADLARRILSELRALSPHDQEIFRLCASEGHSYEDAAARLGISHAAVRNRLARVRQRLRTTVILEKGE